MKKDEIRKSWEEKNAHTINKKVDKHTKKIWKNILGKN